MVAKCKGHDQMIKAEYNMDHWTNPDRGRGLEIVLSVFMPSYGRNIRVAEIYAKCAAF